MKSILLAILAAALPLRPPHKAMVTTPTARDYVQDGLVAMWIGTENAGWGVCDTNAQTFVNLVGDGVYDLHLTDGTTWEDGGLVLREGMYAATNSTPIPYLQIVTLECVFRVDPISVARSRYNFFGAGSYYWNERYNLAMRAFAWDNDPNAHPARQGWMVGCITDTSVRGDRPPTGIHALTAIYSQSPSQDASTAPVALYKNGQPHAASWTVGGNAPSSLLFVGHSSTFPGRFFVGRAYNRPLSPAEIWWNHMIDRAIFGVE